MRRLVVVLVLAALVVAPGLAQRTHTPVHDLPSSTLATAPAITWTMADSVGATWDISVTMTDRGYTGTTLQDLHQYEIYFTVDCPTSQTIATGETVLRVVRNRDGSMKAFLPFTHYLHHRAERAGRGPGRRVPVHHRVEYDARFVSRAEAVANWPAQVATSPRRWTGSSTSRAIRLCPVPQSASHTCGGIYPFQPLDRCARQRLRRRRALRRVGGQRIPLPRSLGAASPAWEPTRSTRTSSWRWTTTPEPRSPATRSEGAGCVEPGASERTRTIATASTCTSTVVRTLR